MPIFEDGKVRVRVDEQGFVKENEPWDRSVSEALARDEGISELTADHWKIIDFLRAFHAEHGQAPMIRVLCRKTGYTLMEIYDLFANGPARGACRVAALPRPDNCV